MMAYPNRSHGISEGKGTTMHLYTLLTNYLEEHLEPGPRPRPEAEVDPTGVRNSEFGIRN